MQKGLFLLLGVLACSTTPQSESSGEPWTWVTCRQAHASGTLGAADRAHCTTKYSASAPSQRYGLRWVFLGHDEETVATYPETQMADLNAVFEDNNMSFFIHTRERIVNPVAVEGATGETMHSVGDLIGDMRQYLATDETDPQAVLDLMVARLTALGVTSAGVSKNGEKGVGLQPTELTLNSQWRATDLHGRVARLNNRLITVVVRQAQGEKSWGHFPREGFTDPTAGLIYLASVTPLSALPHEMGHYFGLPHTHGFWNRKLGDTQAWQTGSLGGFDETDWDALKAVAGPDYSGTFHDTYVAFDQSEADVSALEQAQLLARRVLGWTELTYLEGFQPVASDAEFVALVRAETPPLMKNFVRESEPGSFTGNNCGKSYAGSDQTTLRCKYGDDGDDPLHVLYGQDPILLGTLLFADSTEANLMSYISTDTSDGVRRKKHMTQRQRDLIRLGSRMPSRLRLQNYDLLD